MSKPKRKAIANGNNLNVPQLTDADVPTQEAPTLYEDNFSRLREKIEAKLQPSTSTRKSQSETGKPVVKDSADGGVRASRGKKRTRDGTILSTKPGNDKQTTKKDLKGSIATDGRDGEISLESKEFQKILKELGGTDEDMALMADAASESEMEGIEGVEEGDTQRDDKKTLKQGLSNILKEIALATSGRDALSETSPDEDDEEARSEDDQPATGPSANNAKAKTDPPSTSAGHEESHKKSTGNGRLKCEPRPDWYTVTSEIDDLKDGRFKPTTQSIEQLRSQAKLLLDAENDAYKLLQRSSSQAFYSTVIASGTLSDRISALTLAVQESPLHNVKALDTLLSLARKRGRGQAIDVLRAIKDLFAQGALLPSDRRLYTFSTQPAMLAALSHVKGWKRGDKLPAGVDEKDLICWAFEDWLKARYFEVLEMLEVWCNDEIEFAKSRAVSYVYELLKERPEQESNLLRLLINKLGDPVRKIASQTSYLLMQLLVSHPAMKMVVVCAIETDFLFRAGQSMHSKYYAVTTLNQTALSEREEDVANKLLDIYFALFAGLLKGVAKETSEEKSEVAATSRAQRQRKKDNKASDRTNQQDDELREKLISAVLTGVNRAHPYVGANQNAFDQHLDTLFQICHSTNFNTGIQAMMLIQQLTATHGAAADRFYRTLYDTLLDPRLVVASKQQLYLNLLHRSLKADLSVKRVKAFAKRLLQVLSLHDASFICGSFFLLKELQTSFPSLSALLDQAEQVEDDEEIFHDVDQDTATPKLSLTSAEDVQLANRYDGKKRTPEHANADNSCAWEVLPFLVHYHPSVSVSAEKYILQEKLPGKPDLSLHTLIHFLDRFVYRNPKLASNRLRGTSIMQPMAAPDSGTLLIHSTSGRHALSLNTDEFRSTNDSDVHAEDVFFHKYFKALGKDTKATRKRRTGDDDDDVDGDDEDAVWKAMVESAPDLEGESSEEDLDLSSLDDAMSDGSMPGSDLDMEGDDSAVDIEPGIFDDESDIDAAGSLEQEDGASDAEIVSDLVSSEDERVAGKGAKKSNKQERERRRHLKSLPTFASAADYAKMLDDDEDEDLG